MITITLSILLFLVFNALGGIHFYWLFGGKWGLKEAIPTKNNTVKPLPIPKFPTLVVGLILILFGWVYLIKAEIVVNHFPNWVTNTVYWCIPIIFILRAIGEFNYVGFFKKIKNTTFAKADSLFFSPLCLGIGILGIVIQTMG